MISAILISLDYPEEVVWFVQNSTEGLAMFEVAESIGIEIEQEEELHVCRHCVKIDRRVLPHSRRMIFKVWCYWFAFGGVFVTPLVFGSLESRTIIGTLCFFTSIWVLFGLFWFRANWIRNIRGGQYYLSLDRLCPIATADPPKLHIHNDEDPRYLHCGGGPLFFVSDTPPYRGSTIDRPMEGMILKIAWGWGESCLLLGCRYQNWRRVEIQWPKTVDGWALLTIWDDEGESHTVRLFHLSDTVFTIDHELVVLLRVLATCSSWRSVLRGAIKYEDAKPQESPAEALDDGEDGGVDAVSVAQSDGFQLGANQLT